MEVNKEALYVSFSENIICNPLLSSSDQFVFVKQQLSNGCLWGGVLGSLEGLAGPWLFSKFLASGEEILQSY